MTTYSKEIAMAFMSELQGYSPGRRIYYWFADAFGVLKPEGG